MGPVVKWSLLSVCLATLIGLAIWGVWVIVKNNQKENLKKELNDVIIKASFDAVEEFAKEKAKTVDATQVGAVLTGAAIKFEITEADITKAKVSLEKCVKTEADKTKVRDVVVSIAKTNAEGKKVTEIENQAKKFLKNLTAIAIQEKLKKICEETAKSATSTKVSEFVEQVSSVDRDAAKKQIKDAAKKAARAKADVEGGKGEYAVDKPKITDDAKKALINAKETIKTDVMNAAIQEIAGVTV